MKPRILIFSIAYHPLIGGAELAVQHITDRLREHEFDLITARFSRKHKKHERVGNVNVYRVGYGGRVGKYLYPVFAYQLARKLHRKKPYDAIWSIMAAYAGAAALMFVRRFPTVSYLLTLQEGDPIVHIHRKVRGMRKMWQRIFGRADYVQAISTYLADWARAEGADCPIEVVPNGVDLDIFNAGDTNSPPGSHQSSQSSHYTIITTSRLVKKNGIDILVRAMAKLKTYHLQPTTYKLIIVGSGPDEKKLKQLAKELSVEDVVEFVGEIQAEGIPSYLHNADIFVRASRSEGLGSSFLEAMAAGLPVIGTPVGGIPDFLEDGNTGLFVKTEDPDSLAEKIALLIKHESLRKKLAENGKRLVEKEYNWDQIAKRMDEIFKRLQSETTK